LNPKNDFVINNLILNNQLKNPEVNSIKKIAFEGFKNEKLIIKGIAI
jgi:hypothetical protein